MIQDVELKKNIAASRPHSLWLKEQVLLNSLLHLKSTVMILNIF